jgi:hypothetical protein
MKPEQQRIKIAEMCGWKPHKVIYPGRVDHGWKNVEGGSFRKSPPDYLNDLNAMREAVMSRTPEEQHEINCTLLDICMKAQSWSCCEDEHWSVTVNATAAQRAEAFLKTLNLWEE